jgi:hypothetical protein
LDYVRELFTTHGLHLNTLGKEKLSKQIASNVNSVFKLRKRTSISIGWKSDNINLVKETEIKEGSNEINVSAGTTQGGVRRSTRRNRISTISEDFVWIYDIISY